MAAKKYASKCLTCDEGCNVYPPSSKACKEARRATYDDGYDEMEPVPAPKPVPTILSDEEYALAQIEYHSKLAFQSPRGDWATVEFSETRVPNPDSEVSHDAQRADLIDTVNDEVDRQIEELRETWKASK